MRHWYFPAGFACLLLVHLSQPGNSHQEPPLQPVPVTYRATLKGTVNLDGAPPAGLPAANAALLGQMAASQDGALCLGAPKEQKEQQKWALGARGGLANVVVFVRPERGHYFELAPAEFKPYQVGGAKHEAVMDQPFCSFLPHTLITFPNYTKEGKMTPSGQIVRIKNSSSTSHNSNWGGTSKNAGANLSVPSGGDITIKPVPDRSAIPVHCGMHPWMEGYIWALDTPFATITDRDGAYEIKDVPAGVKLRLFAWHDSGWVSTGRFEGEPIEIEAGKVQERNFQVKAK